MRKISTLMAMGSAAALIGPMTAAERARTRYMRGPDGHGGVAEAIRIHTKAVDDRLEQMGIKDRELNSRIEELEQKMDRQLGRGGWDAEQTWGEQFVAAEEVKSFADDRHRRPGRVRMELKTTITTGTTSGGPVGPQAYRDGVVGMPQRALRVRDLLPVVSIETGSYEYPKQTTRTNNAAPVAEAALKPESAYGWTMQSGTPKVIAHWVPASVQILDDAKQLGGLIDTELRYGLAVAEDRQLLNGDGTGENLTGLVTFATAYSAPIVIQNATLMDQVGLGILQATLADFNPNGIVLHPSDWMKMKMLKDAAGGYLIGDPVTGASGGNGSMIPMLHGLPIALTTSMTAGKFLVGDFAAAATIYDRWQPRVEVSTEHADFFTRTLVAVRAEERLGLAIKQAGALIYGTFA